MALTLTEAISIAERAEPLESYVDELFCEDPDAVVRVADINHAYTREPMHTWAWDTAYVREQAESPTNRYTAADLRMLQRGYREAYGRSARVARIRALDGTDHPDYPDRIYRLFHRDGTLYLRLDNVTDDPAAPPLADYVAATVASARRAEPRIIPRAALVDTIQASYASTYDVPAPSRQAITRALASAPGTGIVTRRGIRHVRIDAASKYALPA